MEAILLQGIARRERREWPEAIERFGAAIRLSPNNALAYLNRGRAEAEKTILGRRPQ